MLISRWTSTNLLMCLVYLQDNEEQSYSTLKSRNTSAQVAGLKPGTKYIFQVRARTSAGCGRFSQSVEIQTGKAGVCVCLCWSIGKWASLNESLLLPLSDRRPSAVVACLIGVCPVNRLGTVSFSEPGPTAQQGLRAIEVWVSVRSITAPLHPSVPLIYALLEGRPCQQNRCLSWLQTLHTLQRRAEVSMSLLSTRGKNNAQCC